MGYEKHQRTHRWQTYRLSRFGAGLPLARMCRLHASGVLLCRRSFVCARCECVPSVFGACGYWLRACGLWCTWLEVTVLYCVRYEHDTRQRTGHRPMVKDTRVTALTDRALFTVAGACEKEGGVSRLTANSFTSPPPCDKGKTAMRDLARRPFRHRCSPTLPSLISRDRSTSRERAVPDQIC